MFQLRMCNVSTFQEVEGLLCWDHCAGFSDLSHCFHSEAASALQGPTGFVQERGRPPNWNFNGNLMINHALINHDLFLVLYFQPNLIAYDFGYRPGSGLQSAEGDWKMSTCSDVLQQRNGHDMFEGSLEAKLPTIWTVETQSREEAERREKIRRKKR